MSVAVDDGFARRMRKEREACGWSQARLAQELRARGIAEIYPSTIAKIEDRNAERPRSVKLTEASAIAELFGLSLDEMVQGDPAISCLLDAARWLTSLRDAAANGQRIEGVLEHEERRGFTADQQEETYELFDAVRRLRGVVQETIQRLEADAAAGDSWIERAWQLRAGGG